jgi:hypothetical protein
MPGQNVQPVLHQHIVIGFVARRAPQIRNTGTLSEFNPDFGDEHPFEVETDNAHRKTPESGCLKGAILAAARNKGASEAATIDAAAWKNGAHIGGKRDKHDGQRYAKRYIL